MGSLFSGGSESLMDKGAALNTYEKMKSENSTQGSDANSPWSKALQNPQQVTPLPQQNPVQHMVGQVQPMQSMATQIPGQLSPPPPLLLQQFARR